MEHKKRGLALLLALTLPLLCGCEGMVSERLMEDLSGWTIETGADVPTQDAFAAETQMATLYLLSADGDRLVPVPAEVTMRDGESLAQAALTALLDGAKLGRTDATWPMNGEGKAPTLSVSDGIATVNLPGAIPRAGAEDAFCRAARRGEYAGQSFPPRLRQRAHWRPGRGA